MPPVKSAVGLATAAYLILWADVWGICCPEFPDYHTGFSKFVATILGVYFTNDKYKWPHLI